MLFRKKKKDKGVEVTYILDKAELAYNLIRINYKYLNHNFTTLNELNRVTKMIESDFTDDDNNVISYDISQNRLFDKDFYIIKLRDSSFVNIYNNFYDKYKSFSSKEISESLNLDSYLCKKIIELKKEDIKALRQNLNSKTLIKK